MKMLPSSLPREFNIDFMSVPGQMHKIFAERPKMVQVVNYPCCVFVPKPEAEGLRAFKERLCSSLWTAGVRIPQHTASADCWILCSNFVKVHSTVLRKALEAADVEACFVGRFGMKQYLSQNLSELRHVLDCASKLVTCDIGRMHRDSKHIYLWGLKVERSLNGMDSDRGMIGRVYPLLPLCQRAPSGRGLREGWLLGSVEFKRRPGQSWGNDTGKCMQLLPCAAPPHQFPDKSGTYLPTKDDMYHKQRPLRNLTAKLVEHKHRAGGTRLEVRHRAEDRNLRLHEIAADTEFLDYFIQLQREGKIKKLKIPMREFTRSLALAWDETEALYNLHSTLHTLDFTLSFPHYTLYIPHSTLHTLHSAFYSLHFKLHTLHCTLYTFHSTRYPPPLTLPTPQYTLCTSHPTLWTLHSTLDTPHLTLYTLHSSHYNLHSTPHI